MGSVISSTLTGHSVAAAAPAAADRNSNSPYQPCVQSFHSSDKLNHLLDELKPTPQLLVIDFSAVWCGPCNIMNPVIDSLCQKYTSVQFAKVDISELSDVARSFGVQNVPTFVLMKQGKEVCRLVGVNKVELEKKIQLYCSP